MYSVHMCTHMCTLYTYACMCMHVCVYKCVYTTHDLDNNTFDLQVGLMFASKAVVQLVANPFVGPLTNRLQSN